MNGGFYENTVIAAVKRLILAESPDVSEFERMEWFFNIHKDVFPSTHFQSTGIFTKNLEKTAVNPCTVRGYQAKSPKGFRAGYCDVSGLN
ncbi:hypothetical protein [Photorhabdus bodei]|uniref:Uncharacterized protein n=1 Tax=Photorhabdus bodei TaxID=2029681 RepID=A0A329X918_9GAMM|nr:hypothetical protein [Photorhabdus bodei]NDK98114.1 hypothetical protein [Photorhabdus bodei]NDL02364.1 hypothetical protein [Photorhabdus bodei]NDL06438.1 hypothetical protein [Photorhabdus bodei]RAX13111.1 hypothetical protein CKY02_09010 [Photorhabdus bodei]